MADTRSTDSVIPHEVRDLIQESQKIQGWIEGLADHADEARPEVYRKVLSDYEQRLAGVNEALAKHRAELVDTLEKRKAELAGLRTDRDEQAAELEEARLRHAVGEYDDAEWEERRDRVQQALDDVDELLTGEEETVAELDEIIASIGTAGPRLVTDREPSPAFGVPDAIDPQADAADAPAEAAPTRP
ncbi:MAG: hypothetical protein R3266_11990, partial [Gemmatimonadota bacterium]|nr:hypothetical protein [Gemmatimonadota bacterium]